MLWLLYSVAIQSAERAELEMRTSSSEPPKKAELAISPIVNVVAGLFGLDVPVVCCTPLAYSLQVELSRVKAM